MGRRSEAPALAATSTGADFASLETNDLSPTYHGNRRTDKKASRRSGAGQVVKGAWFELMRRAWLAEVSSTEKLVLVRLAFHADARGNCWPSVAHLSKMTGLSRRGIQMALNTLEAAGHIERAFRANTSSYFRVHPRTVCAGEDDAQAQPLAEPRADHSPNERNVYAQTTNEHSGTQPRAYSADDPQTIGEKLGRPQLERIVAMFRAKGDADAAALYERTLANS